MQAHLTDSYIARVKTPDLHVSVRNMRMPGFVFVGLVQGLPD